MKNKLIYIDVDLQLFATKKNSQDNDKETYIDSSGVERYKGSNNRVQSASSGSSSSTKPKGYAEGNKTTGTMDYNSGNGYTNRESRFTWNDNGKQVTTYSNATRYEDALAEAIKNGQLSNNAKLSQAVTYGTSTRSRDENGNVVVGKNSASSSKGGIYSNTGASKDSSTGRDAAAEALAHMAMASSPSNAWNKGKTLDSYYDSMDDFYDYFHSLTPEEQYGLYHNGTGTQSGAILSALRALENGYTPTGISPDTSGIPVTDSMMKAEEYPEYLQNLIAEVRGTAGDVPMYIPSTGTGDYIGIGGNIISSPVGSGDYVAGGRPTYNSRWDDDTEKLIEEMLNREAFSYDLASDPLYQQIKSQYVREGTRAMNEALASAALGAGGMNSYAISAANQANNNFMAQLGDLMPTLQQNAYNMYADDFNRDVTNMGILQGLENMDWGKYRDYVGDYYADRDYAYNAWRDSVADSQWQTQFDYGVSRDALEDARYDSETAYQQAMAFLSSGVMPSSSLLSAAGISENDARNLLGTMAKDYSSDGYPKDGADDGDSYVPNSSAYKSLPEGVAGAVMPSGGTLLRELMAEGAQSDEYYDANRAARSIYDKGGSADDIKAELIDRVNSGLIDDVEALLIAQKYGISVG